MNVSVCSEWCAVISDIPSDRRIIESSLRQTTGTWQELLLFSFGSEVMIWWFVCVWKFSRRSSEAKDARGTTGENANFIMTGCQYGTLFWVTVILLLLRSQCGRPAVCLLHVTFMYIDFPDFTVYSWDKRQWKYIFKFDWTFTLRRFRIWRYLMYVTAVWYSKLQISVSKQHWRLQTNKKYWYLMVKIWSESDNILFFLTKPPFLARKCVLEKSLLEILKYVMEGFWWKKAQYCPDFHVLIFMSGLFCKHCRT